MNILFCIYFLWSLKQNANNDCYQLDNLGHSILFTFCDTTRYSLIVFSDKALYNNKAGQNDRKITISGLLKLTEGIQQIEKQFTHEKSTVCQLWMVGVSGILAWGFFHRLLPTRWISAEMKGALQNTRSFFARGGSLGLELRVGNHIQECCQLSLNFRGKGMGETNGSGILRM